MHNTVKVPKSLKIGPILVDCVAVQTGDRVRHQQQLASLRVGDDLISVTAPCDGWIRLVAAKEKSQVKRGDVLFVIDSMPAEDYHVDSEEVNGLTELGENGRRGSLREGQRQHVKAYAHTLVDAPQAHQGNGQKMFSGIDAHPMMANAKEGVPLKQSAHASQNQDRFNEDVGNDPELQNTLGNELKARYAAQSAPSAAPTLKA